MLELTAVFDIGKTHKKFHLFDASLQEVHHEQIRISEIIDDDGFPADDLASIEQWIITMLTKYLQHPEFKINAINFSTYGASLVHTDAYGKAVAPLYNYLKPYPEELLQQFRQQYGDDVQFTSETASPMLGMLNSGRQLYWLKYRKENIFDTIKYALHFPQYLSFRLSGQALSEYTSIGCHTALWDYQKNHYHRWVEHEGIQQKLAPIVPTAQISHITIREQNLDIGVGIHDSSAALLPYLRGSKESFLLISTGTWSITLNPFNNDPLTPEDLEHDCLNFLGVAGQTIRATRLFLGKEHEVQTEILSKRFENSQQQLQTMSYDAGIAKSLKGLPDRIFKWEALSNVDGPAETQWEYLPNFEMAYHKLISELVDLQIASSMRAKGTTEVEKVYIDGGFVHNKLFLHVLANKWHRAILYSAEASSGSAMGAALIMHRRSLPHDFLQDNYKLSRIRQTIF